MALAVASALVALPTAHAAVRGSVPVDAAAMAIGATLRRGLKGSNASSGGNDEGQLPPCHAAQKQQPCNPQPFPTPVPTAVPNFVA